IFSLFLEIFFLSDILTICFLSFIDRKNISKNKLKMCRGTGNSADWITSVTVFVVTGHILSLFLGIFFRSINDKKQIVKMSDKSMGLISTLSLNMFLVMAMMKLKIWELYDLAIPLTVILIVQTIITVLIAIFIMFKIMGKNYDA